MSQHAVALPHGVRYGEHAGIDAIIVETPQVRAAVSLHGGQVLSYAPAGHVDVLWLSPTTGRPPKAIRGGVPVCWPWFAREGMPPEAPQHGVARTAAWRLDAARVAADGAVELELSPDANIHSLQLRQALRIGRVLEQTLVTHNPTGAVVRMTQALHSYFQVGDATRVGIDDLTGLDYLDKPTGFARMTQREPFAFDGGECDRIYLDTRGEFTLVDPALDRRIRIEATGSHALVVWNAGAEKIRSFTDVPADGWKTYFCLEVANAGTDVIAIPPGGTHRLGQRIAMA